MNDQNLTERRLKSETVFHGRLLHVKRDTVRLPNGSESTREIILHPGAVVMIPVLKDETLIMERQYRYAPDQVFYELPAGKIDPGEEPLATGKRELLEETGYEAECWTFLCNIHPAIGYTDEKMALYLAEGLTHGPHQRDQDEFLEVVEISLDDALGMLRNNEITDAKTAVGLFWAEKVLRGDWKVS